MPRVLVVDDDADLRDAVRVLLEDAGHIVLEASDGVGALQILQQSDEPLIVVLDLVMARLDGEGVLQAVSDDARLAEQHAFIVCTASRRPAPRDLLSALAAPFVLKPFDTDELLTVIDEAAARLSDQQPSTPPLVTAS